MKNFNTKVALVAGVAALALVGTGYAAWQFNTVVDTTKDASGLVTAAIEAKFKDINEAYEVLGDSQKRQRYDSLGANWQGGAEYTPPPGFENFNVMFWNWNKIY